MKAFERGDVFMLTQERHELILNLLEEKDTIKISELIHITGASESTIRRDLSQLEEENVLKRIHGGATLSRKKAFEMSVAEKSARNIEEKRKIAHYAASLIESGDCIFLDAGTTTYEMIPFLTDKDITVVTNGLPHVAHLVQNEIVLFVIGGAVKHKTGALIGVNALESLKQYRFDKAFIGANGVDAVYGYTTPDTEEAMVKRCAINLAKESFILADETKISEVSFAKIADLNQAVVITNELEDEQKALLKEKTDIKVVTT